MITKAIIPVAGIGTRFLPASKSVPKEMFPLVDKPVIQHIVEEAVQSGITDIIFVTSLAKKSLEDHFDHDAALEHYLKEKKKDVLLEVLRPLTKLANFYFIRQPGPRGDGDAILRARKLIGSDEAVVVMWGDDVIIDSDPTLRQLMGVYEEYRRPVFAVEEIAREDVHRYGVIAGHEVSPSVYQVSHIVEKPLPKEAPSNLAIVGRYILNNDVLDELASQKPAEDGEIRTSHALRDLLQRAPVYAYKFPGIRFDCGNKLGWLKANIYVGMKDKEIGREVRSFIDSVKSNV